MLFIIAPKSLLALNLTEHIQVLYAEKSESLRKKIKDLNKW